MALRKQYVMPFLLQLHHITWGKDWKMASVVLHFKIFMGPEWNDALDSHKLMLSQKFIGNPLRSRILCKHLCSSLIQFITSCSLSWSFYMSLLPGIKKEHGLMCVNLPGTGQFVCLLDCLVLTKFRISQLLLTLRKKQCSLNLMWSKWGKEGWKINMKNSFHLTPQLSDKIITCSVSISALVYWMLNCQFIAGEVVDLFPSCII